MGFLGPCLVMDMGDALNEGDRRERGEHNQCPRKDGGVGCESCDEGGEQGHEESFWTFSDPDIAIKPQPFGTGTRVGHAQAKQETGEGSKCSKVLCGRGMPREVERKTNE